MPTEPNILIKTSLNHCVELINEGSNPTEALKKTAEYYDLNYDYTHRVGEALNVALHYNHFKTAEDKAAEFPIADIESVNRELYNTQEKTAAQDVSDQFPNPELYESLPDFNKAFTDSGYAENYVKIASAEVEPKAPLLYETMYRKSAEYVRNLEQEALEKRSEVMEMKNGVEATFLNIANGFKKDAGYRTSFEEFESQVFSKYGEEAVPYLDLIYKTANLKEERGVHDKGYLMFNDCPELEKFSSFIDKIAELEVLSKEAKAADEEYNEKLVLMETIKVASGDIKKNDLTKEAGGIIDEVFGLVKDKISKEEKKPMGGMGVGNNKMLRFEQQLVLQRMLTQDPILSKDNPKNVIEAYETFARLSGSLAAEYSVAVSVVRKLLGGQSLSPYDAGSFLDTENALLKNKMIHSGHNVGGK